MMNTQTTESVDLKPESFTATIDPAKVDADTLETLGVSSTTMPWRSWRVASRTP